MERSITEEGKTILYTLRQSARAQQIRISVHEGGRVTVTKPVRVSIERMERFIYEKFDWIVCAVAAYKKKPPKILGHYSVRDFREHKKEAEKIIRHRTAELNQAYGYEVEHISIRNQRMRWGSASRKKNLNFNYKIIFLPERLRDYIIVHELCHLKELNHSKRFWALVAEQIPDYATRRREIRAY